MDNSKYNKIKALCLTELSSIEEMILSSINVRNELEFVIKDFLKAPSKMIRSLLSILYLKSLDYTITNNHLKILSVVEIVHNASLIHDDIIDSSLVRRGKETICAKFGNKLGVIAGDYLLSIAFELLSQLDSGKIFPHFVNTLKMMCVGEINQYFEKFRIGTIADYIEKSKNKTGYLFEIALTSPLMLSCCNHDVITQASKFGMNYGIAFQICDDILNITLKDDNKPTKNDIEEGIYTAPVIYAQDVNSYMQGVEKAGCLLNNYIVAAFEQIRTINDNKYKRALIELLELLRYEK